MNTILNCVEAEPKSKEVMSAMQSLPLELQDEILGYVPMLHKKSVRNVLNREQIVPFIKKVVHNIHRNSPYGFDKDFMETFLEKGTAKVVYDDVLRIRCQHARQIRLRMNQHDMTCMEIRVYDYYICRNRKDRLKITKKNLNRDMREETAPYEIVINSHHRKKAKSYKNSFLKQDYYVYEHVYIYDY